MLTKNTALAAAAVLTLVTAGLGIKTLVLKPKAPAPVVITQQGPIVVVSSKVLPDAGALAPVDAGKALPVDAGAPAAVDAGHVAKSVPGKK